MLLWRESSLNETRLVAFVMLSWPVESSLDSKEDSTGHDSMSKATSRVSFRLDSRHSSISSMEKDLATYGDDSNNELPTCDENDEEEEGATDTSSPTADENSKEEQATDTSDPTEEGKREE